MHEHAGRPDALLPDSSASPTLKPELRAAKAEKRTGTDFQDQDLSSTELTGAFLVGAKLDKTVGLAARSLRGSILTGATLPEPIKDGLKDLSVISEASKNSGAIFALLMAASLYCLITSTSASALALTGGISQIPLPAVQTSISALGFFLFAPLILFAIQLYLHLNLQYLWEAAASLPAVFPDGRPAHEKTYPWLASTFLRCYLNKDEPCPLLPRLQVRLTQILAWWTVPATIFFLWWKAGPIQNMVLRLLQSAVCTIAVFSAMTFWRIAVQTLEGVPPSELKWLRSIFHYRGRLFATVVVLGILATVSIIGRDLPPSFYEANSLVEEWVRFLFPSSPDFSEQLLSEGSYSLERLPPDLSKLVGPRFLGVNLKNPLFFHAFAPGAEFRRSKLDTPMFALADLRYAVFSECSLFDSNFAAARLSNARFLMTHFYTDAKFFEADLSGAQFAGSMFHQKANFTKALLYGADFSGAYGLHWDDFKEAFFDGTTVFPPGLKPSDMAAATPARRASPTKGKAKHRSRKPN